MMELIKITHTKRGFGFTGKTEILEYSGVKFDNGKIAYADGDGDIYTAKNADTIKDSLPDAKIESIS